MLMGDAFEAPQGHANSNTATPRTLTAAPHQRAVVLRQELDTLLRRDGAAPFRKAWNELNTMPIHNVGRHKQGTD
jgi:hypothetical protein